MSKINIFSLSILTFALSACGMSHKKDTVIYSIPPASEHTVLENSCATNLNLQITTPSEAPGLETRRIAIMQPNNQLNYYQSIRWAAPVSDMLNTVLLTTYENSGAFQSVSSDMENVTPDLTLNTDIRNFEVDTTTGKNIVTIRLAGKIIDNKNHKLLATIISEKTMAPAADKIDNIVATFDYLTAQAASELLQKTAQATCKPNKKAK